MGHVPKPSKVVHSSNQRPKDDAEFLSVLSRIHDTLATECDCGFWRVFVSSCYSGTKDDQSDHKWQMIVGGSGKSGDPFRISKDGEFQGLPLVNTGSFRYPALPDDPNETNDNRNWFVRIYDHNNGEIQTVGPPNPKVKVCDKTPEPQPTFEQSVSCNCNRKCCEKDTYIGIAYSEDEYMTMMAQCNAIAFNQVCCKGCEKPPERPKGDGGSTWGGGGAINWGGGGGGWYGGWGGGSGWGGGGGIPYPTEPPVRFCDCSDLSYGVIDGSGSWLNNPSSKNHICKLPPGLTYETFSFGCEQGKKPDPCIIPSIIPCRDKMDIRKIDDMIDLPWTAPTAGSRVKAHKYVDETTYPAASGQNNRTRF